MVTLETEWHPSTKLNVVGAALDFTSVDPLPETVTRDEIEEYCYALEQLYGSYVDELVAETTLSSREAQTWVLRNLVHEGADRLSFEAIGLYVWAIGRSADGDPLSRTIVTGYHERATAKIDAAEATVKRTQPPPYPDDLFAEPTMLWVEGEVAERLARRLGPEEGFSDALERLLDETLDAVPLADLVERFRDAGAAYVGVRTVQPGWDRELPLSVHAPPSTDVDVEADAVRVDGTPYPFGVETRPPDAGTGSLLTLYGDGVTPDAGVERLSRALTRVEATLPELVERAREAGVSGLAVADDPVGAGAHLLAIRPPDAASGPFEHLDRLALDDRTLTVGRVTTLSADSYADRADGATLLWTAPDADLDERRDLPADPVERRERFPTAVLHTD
ncbi:hypothetical protein [Haloplanus halophilus]|uniref:hypothetical protein n=1 Tax=Haloplanus halophilus TaxID=2949993 RepID=UPI00204049C8|nr:hypothetical protein [Haloplanus sp. GDY1]